ncbi:PLD nuclease N-terminal domain-containing protein [Demequina sp. NBRC 110057]|uniref:PLD nuclease N-terminal domain-containing protein n=1 Tax=Demequina sp. NBRC 110057 TaxID=1570346 RepID=UPI000A007D8F|nr:PLD nuclease N-terminal domain-containing protein [Demequina sp. NBRC 110057]
MQLAANPLVPTTYDWVWSVLTAAVLVITIAAAVSEVRHSRVLSGRVLTVWLIVTLIAPPLGGIAWFLAGRRQAQRDMEALYPEAPPAR